MSVDKFEREITVQNIMQRHPITIHAAETVQDAVDKMTEHRVAALPVVDDGGYLHGILTVNDLLRLVQDAEQTLDSDLAIYDESYVVTDMIRQCLGTDQVIDVMSTMPITIDQEDSLKQAAKQLIEHQVHHIPVVSKDRRLLGIVSSIDFVRLATEKV